MQPTVHRKMRPALTASTPVIVSCVSVAQVSDASGSAVPIACGLMPTRAERPVVNNSTVTTQKFSIPNFFFPMSVTRLP